MYAPGVVGISYKLGTVYIVNSNDIALEISLEEEAIKSVLCIATGSVHHSDGKSRFVVYVQENIAVPLLSKYLRAIKNVFVKSTVYILRCAYTVSIVGEGYCFV